MKYWLISDADVDAVRAGLVAPVHAANGARNCITECEGWAGNETRRQALHALDSGLHITDVVPADMQGH